MSNFRPILVVVWQKPIQRCKVIFLKLKINFLKKLWEQHLPEKIRSEYQENIYQPNKATL